MILVRLSDSEAEVARLLARMRTANNRAHGVKNSKIGPQAQEDIERDGVGAEMAFCKQFNAWPDMTISVRCGGPDCTVTLPNGRQITVDVKNSPLKNARLLCPINKELADSEVYVLVTGIMPVYTIVGWAWASELLRPENVTDLGHGDTYALDQSALRRFRARRADRKNVAI